MDRRAVRRAGRHGSLCDGAPDDLPFSTRPTATRTGSFHRRGRLCGTMQEEDELRSMSRRLPGAGSGRMGQYLLVQRGRRAEQRRQVLYDGLRCEDLVPALRPSLGDKATPVNCYVGAYGTMGYTGSVRRKSSNAAMFYTMYGKFLQRQNTLSTERRPRRFVARKRTDPPVTEPIRITSILLHSRRNCAAGIFSRRSETEIRNSGMRSRAPGPLADLHVAHLGAVDDETLQRRADFVDAVISRSAGG